MMKIFTTLESTFKDPINILKFVLGVLGEFLPGVESAYRTISSNAAKGKQYAQACKAAFTPNKEITPPTQFSQMESKMNGAANKKEYCEKTRDTIKDWYVESHSEDSKNDGGLLKHLSFAQPLVFGVRGAFTPADKLCEQIKTNKAPKTHKKIMKQYNSMAEFMKQCVYFDGINCSNFDPESFGIQAFAKKATTYYHAVNKMADCLKTNVPGGDALAAVFSKNNILEFALKQVASTVVNIMTFGAWGGLNGGYHMVQLGLKIKKYLDNPNVDTAYSIGGIVGRAMKIILSISGIPTVRRLKKKKFRKN